MTERPIRYIPRWLHYQANIEADTSGWLFTEIPPNAFANETIWPFKLDYLAITGVPPWASTELDEAGQFWGGLGSCVNLELGISGSSDVNQVVATAGTIMRHHNRRIKGPPGVIYGVNPYLDGAYFVHFKHPYLLARGNGFNVQFVSTRDTVYYNDSVFNEYDGVPSFVAHGYGATTGRPKMLAGTYRQTDEPGVPPVILNGGAITLNDADLVNDGEEDIYINKVGMAFVLSDNAPWIIGTNMRLWGAYSNYLVNPINGPKWMPGSEALTVSSLCPKELTQPYHDEWPTVFVPAVYEFPDNTKLLRRQRLSVKMSNHAFVAAQTSLPIKADVTLFGYLEVR